MASNQPLLIEIGEGLSLMLGLSTVTTWNSKNRPKNTRLGTFGFNIETNSLEYWDGDCWLEATMEKV